MTMTQTPSRGTAPVMRTGEPASRGRAGSALWGAGGAGTGSPLCLGAGTGPAVLGKWLQWQTTASVEQVLPTTPGLEVSGPSSRDGRRPEG